MNILLCGLAKMENNYIVEWVEHYKKLGVSHIILYDNNDIDGERLYDKLAKYVKSGFVEIIEILGQKINQIAIYNKCYKENANKYDWITFLDIDEFVVLHNDKKLSTFLKRKVFNTFDGICLCWRISTDNGLIKVINNDYSLMKRFTEFNSHGSQIKTFIRTKNIENINSQHCGNTLAHLCNAVGQEIEIQGAEHNICNKMTFDCACINHYKYKTIEEFINIRCKRGNIFSSNIGYRIEDFYKYNKQTAEKDNFIKSIMNEN